MRYFPPPDLIMDELEGQPCAWQDEHVEPCDAGAVTTRYDDFTRSWIPVCDDHRR